MTGLLLPREDLLPLIEDGATKADLRRITGLSKEGLDAHLRRTRLVRRMSTCAVCRQPTDARGRHERVCSAACERQLNARRRKAGRADHSF